MAGQTNVASTSAPGSDPLEPRVGEIGRRLLAAARSQRRGIFSSRFWSDQLVDWAMKDASFKIQLFRFVDAFPSLQSPTAVYDCLVDYLDRPDVTLPPGMDLGLKAGGLAKRTLTRAITNRITALAGNFIAGTDLGSALGKLEKLRKRGIGFSVDLLGETCASRAEAEVYQQRYLDLIEQVPRHVGAWPDDPRIDRDHLGSVPRANVSIKISSLSARADPVRFEAAIVELKDMLRPILEAAAGNGVLVNFDMEQFVLKDLTLELFERCAEEIDFPAGLALQSYLTTGLEDARRIVAWTRRTGRQVTVRLIKGAYWDFEVIRAEEMGWPVPVWTRKRQTDAAFERMAGLFVDAIPESTDAGGVKLALGSHNVRSIAHTLALLDARGLPQSAVELQMLHGMADQLKAAALGLDLRVREYVPLGQMVPGMAYLVRRLLENTSNESWLKAGFADNAPDEVLLAPPDATTSAEWDAPQHDLGPGVDGLADGRPFSNEPWRDFCREDVRERFGRAVVSAHVPGVAFRATVEIAEEAVGRAAAAFPAWRDTAPLERSEILVAAASIIRDRRDELSAVIIREAGKTWGEADADTCEAIDFCEYYSRAAVGLFEPKRLGRFVGELNHTWYQPRGPAVVVSPWNFPLAICAGMTSAALVTGNTVIVKPSSQTPGIARLMGEIFHAAGVPEGVLQPIVGPGSTVGSALVRDPRVALVAFTGSKEVGLDIIQAAGSTAEGQSIVKKVVAEMGGKNAIVVDESADLDEAVVGVRQSAFGYSGQKCSACSRVIVVESVHDAFLKRLTEAARSLVIGDPADPNTDVGPVIDEAAAAKIRQYIEIGRGEGRLELAVECPPDLEELVGKPYVGPHIFSGIRPEHRLANEEIFGPVLSVIRVADFAEALRVANATAYKLTGGVYSRRPAHLELARREFRVGNLYLNRPITGALVGRQPFGGFGLSGTGTKAGGNDYLLHFVEPRACTENTMRHGFAPGLE